MVIVEKSKKERHFDTNGFSKNLQPPAPQWEKTLKRAGNFNWWTYNSIEIKVGGIKINVIWGLYIPKTIRCIKIYF